MCVILVARDLHPDWPVCIAANRDEFKARPSAGPRVLQETPRAIGGLDLRHVTIDRAIYWFTLHEDAQVVRIEGIFHGGQDHLGRMLARLTAEGEAG